MKLTKEILESTLKDFDINIIEIFELSNDLVAIVGNNEKLPNFTTIPSKFIISLLSYKNVEDVEIKGGTYIPMISIRCYIKP